MWHCLIYELAMADLFDQVILCRFFLLCVERGKKGVCKIFDQLEGG